MLNPSGVHAQLQLPLLVLDNAVVVGRVLGIREWTPPGKFSTPMQYITLGDADAFFYSLSTNSSRISNGNGDASKVEADALALSKMVTDVLAHVSANAFA